MENTLYSRLSNVNFLAKSYTLKFLFVAFIGIHLPLIGLVIAIAFNWIALSALNMIVLVLILTLIATAFTLFALNNLLKPLKKTQQSLLAYSNYRSLPTLPVNYEDEAGILMRQVQACITDLDKMLKEKQDFAALLSHDLRTPMSQVIAICGLIKDENDPKEVNYLCDILMDEAKDQIKFMEDILLLIKNDSAIIHQQELKEVSLHTMLKKVASSVEEQRKAKNIQFNYQISDKLNLTVKRELFEHVLQNLLSNSIKFSYENSKVQIIASKKDNTSTIEIIDQGIGFDPNHANLIFERFTQTRKLGTFEETSTGIGLYLAKKIIEKHDGTIKAHSNGYNKGANFTIKLNS